MTAENYNSHPWGRLTKNDNDHAALAKITARLGRDPWSMNKYELEHAVQMLETAAQLKRTHESIVGLMTALYDAMENAALDHDDDAFHRHQAAFKRAKATEEQVRARRAEHTAAYPHLRP